MITSYAHRCLLASIQPNTCSTERVSPFVWNLRDLLQSSRLRQVQGSEVST